MRNFVTLFAISLAVATGLYVQYIRHQVAETAQDIQVLKSAIKKDKKALHVLKVELAFLTSPAQLQSLSDKHLGMAAPRSDQVLISIDQIPLRRDLSQRIYVYTPPVDPSQQYSQAAATQTAPDTPYDREGGQQ